MCKYSELKARQEVEVNNFPFMFAFNNDQFKKGMEKLGLSENDTKKIYAIGGGGYVKKTDMQSMIDMYDSFEKELNNAIEEDTTGDNFIYDMFYYELNNHEYCITQNIEDTLKALGISVKRVTNDPRMLKAMKKACSDTNKWYREQY